MERSSNSIQSVVDASNTASKKADKGIKIVTDTIEQMNLVQDSVKDTSRLINALGDKSNEIGKIVDIITEIDTVEKGIVMVNETGKFFNLPPTEVSHF